MTDPVLLGSLLIHSPANMRTLLSADVLLALKSTSWVLHRSHRTIRSFRLETKNGSCRSVFYTILTNSHTCGFIHFDYTSAKHHNQESSHFYRRSNIIP